MDASIDATSARHEAAQGGYLDVVEALVDAGAFLDMKSDDGNTPVHRAAWYGHVHVVTSLTSVGANLSLRNNNGETALHLAPCPLVNVLYQFVGAFVPLSMHVYLRARMHIHCGLFRFWFFG